MAILCACEDVPLQVFRAPRHICTRPGYSKMLAGERRGQCILGLKFLIKIKLFLFFPLQALEIIRGCRGMNVVGCDLVEVAPIYDPSGGCRLLRFRVIVAPPRLGIMETDCNSGTKKNPSTGGYWELYLCLRV